MFEQDRSETMMNIEAPRPVPSRHDVAAWLIDWIANELEMPAAEIDTAHSLLDYSMSSVTATILVGDLEDWLDLRLSPTLVWDYPSIDAMTDHLLAQAADAAPAAAQAAPLKDAGQLLEDLDGLSDEEVDALLKQLS
jgi:acyl carrier protein